MAKTLYNQWRASSREIRWALFCSLAIHDTIEKCDSELNVWYLDDGTLGDEPQIVYSDFKKIIEAGQNLGVDINFSKCEITIIDSNEPYNISILDNFKALAPDLKHVKTEYLTLLGAPISSTASDKVLETKLVELKRMCERLKNIDPHDALFLLKNCFAIPKLTYFLRSAPCYESDILGQYDLELRSSLESILNIQFNDRSWMQCSLPVNLGGLGVRAETDIALPAFLSSAFASHTLVNKVLPNYFQNEDYPAFTNAQSLWMGRMGGNRLCPSQPDAQMAWDLPYCKMKLDQLIDQSTTEIDKSRLLAVSAENSSDWLQALPIPSLGLKMNEFQLKIACSLRLCSTMCQPHTCICGTKVDSLGTHGLSCKKSMGRFPRHSHVNDLIKRVLSSAHIPSVLEPNGVSRTDGKRPDGMSVFPWKSGKLLCWDFTCCDTLAPSHLATSSLGACKIAENAENAKLTKYSNLGSDYEVVPVGVETLGPWGPHGIKFIKEVGAKIRIETGEPRSTAYILQSISMAIQRGNAASIMGTVQGSKKLEEIYYL